MFKRAILAFCAVTMLCLSGFGTTKTADASWRDVRRFSRNIDRTHRQLHRSLDRERSFYNRRYSNSYSNRGSYGRNSYYGPNRGYSNGFISTPYFSIGF